MKLSMHNLNLTSLPASSRPYFCNVIAHVPPFKSFLASIILCINNMETLIFMGKNYQVNCENNKN